MSTTQTKDLSFDTPVALRRAIREGRYRGFTNLHAQEYVQGNLMIVPADHADPFEAFCRANPQALPLLGRSERGVPFIASLGAELDLRTDVGGYTVFRDGVAVETPVSIVEHWRDDLVAFVLGCSFSFETLLRNHGVTLRHLDEGNVSAMYVTSLPTIGSGPFGGPLVVSMRALSPADAIRATMVSARHPMFHGAPVHIGLPELIGIDDLAQSYGGHGLTALRADELPVFWACGATAQLAAMHARLPFCITHYKAHMVVTDVRIDDLVASPLI
ncbi:DUF1445 domain-containing protein [Burkholderia gladioli pv. gladioli]|uniref:DUF1445 domain-containing protein n=1 Tax=Burkholderia gladioli TaxID=28095 RepID=A0A095HDQ6_BURGA|nr:DUF1445 domain-containing protein [Burkholderia gladioli]AJX00212.1 hypothetical protein BM43_4012 [Burkholderia gladioli]ASD79863.1 hypothetical protein CEJ98_13245 [Burkholderia gladioli pv. gladioli]AWY54894.1 hypothetical protein A8H28_27880 [Burkholderia gladioli pv. gladioli]KGC11679.1 hypothetical protein DM48_7486 [Burkholderia gladioli]MDJ1164127.1 DUF1445 domain-containing protein [Burkholderia gladioli pv. gladioli]